MQNFMTVREAAALWGIGERRLTTLCREGRIPGAVKNPHWRIPADAEKPQDQRVRSGRYMRTSRPAGLPLPIGVSDYREAVSDYYYVDKTLLIRDFLDEKAKVSLFTRPRRFGKTLNMDMLKTFFEKTSEDTSVYFRDKKIWACGEKYRAFQGKYPVIFITFKDVKYATWEESRKSIAGILSAEFLRHKELQDSALVNAYDKAYYTRVAMQQPGEVELEQALLVLSRMLHEHHGVAPMIMIDEYDTPIQQGYVAGFYEQAIRFMRNFFSGGLKDNPHLSFGFMTGILRVAKESIFSGLNNIKINSVLDNRYSTYFGFTAQEVKEMAAYYRSADRYDEICAWYDGYRFGDTEIFNPWSVSSYFANGCEPRAFWQATGSNDIIGEVMKTLDEPAGENLQMLLQGKTVKSLIDVNVIYPQLHRSPAAVFSFLLMAGYLKTVHTVLSFSGTYICELAIPNREIGFVYNKEILERLPAVIPQAGAVSFQAALVSGDSTALRDTMEQLLRQSVSFHDTAKESFYHGFVLGLCALVDNRFEIQSNREAGEGRFDICLRPRTHDYPGILIELKATSDTEKLHALARQAVQQIERMDYCAVLRQAGVEQILKYGVAFSGKNVEIEVV